MKFAFHIRAPIARQRVLAEALAAGAALSGDTIEIHEGFKEVLDVDGGIVFGIAGIGADHPRLPFDAYQKAKKHLVFFDKGYTRNDCVRVAVNCFQPLEFVGNAKMSTDRYHMLKLRPNAFGKLLPAHVLFDGASWKYCEWQGLGDWGEWGQKMVNKIRQHTKSPILYRPRPVREGIPPITGAIPSNMALDFEFMRTRLVISYGGNLGFDAIVSGTPHFAIGDSIARCMSETDWNRLAGPYIPPHLERLQWFANVAYLQWFPQEIADGTAWKFIRTLIDKSWPRGIALGTRGRL